MPVFIFTDWKCTAAAAEIWENKRTEPGHEREVHPRADALRPRPRNGAQDLPEV